MAMSDVTGVRTPQLNSTEAWLLFTSLYAVEVGTPALFNAVCQGQWSRCIKCCNSVDMIDRVLSAAFQAERSTESDYRACQQQLLAKRSVV